jgi:type IV pilus assembly protein PilM
MGLDIGSNSIKGVLLRKGPQGLALAKSSVLSVGTSADSKERASVIRQLVDSMDAGTCPIATAVGGPGSVLRAVLLPKMTPQELKTALSFEAEKHIPFKLEETFLDSCILGDRPGGRMEVFLGAARKELVNAHLELLTASGVVPQIVDLEAAALANAWEISHPQDLSSQAVVLIDVGARATTLNFLTGTSLQFTREIPAGGDFFTQGISETLQVDLPAAERLKRTPGDRAAEVQAALQPRLEEWLTQSRASFDFYENQFGHGVERIFLSGGSAALNGMASWFKEASGLPAQLWDPLSGLAVSEEAHPQQGEGLSLGVAVGLAVRGLAR